MSRLPGRLQQTATIASSDQVVIIPPSFSGELEPAPLFIGQRSSWSIASQVQEGTLPILDVTFDTISLIKSYISLEKATFKFSYDGIEAQESGMDIITPLFSSIDITLHDT